MTYTNNFIVFLGEMLNVNKKIIGNDIYKWVM